MAERSTIRPTTETYEKLNEERKEHGLSWDDYLTALYEETSLDTVELPSEQVEEIATLAGKKAADEVEGRLR